MSLLTLPPDSISSLSRLYHFQYAKPTADLESLLEDVSSGEFDDIGNISKFKLGMALAGTALGVGPGIEGLLADFENAEGDFEMPPIPAKEMKDEEVLRLVWDESLVSDEEVSVCLHFY